MKNYTWEQRSYEVWATPSQFLQMKKQMDEQDELKDSHILLKIEYNASIGKAKLVDKVKHFTETPATPPQQEKG